MAECIYCKCEYIDERLEAGYNYCLSDSCQKTGCGETLKEFRSVYTVALLHKSNYFWVKKTDLKQLNTRGDLPNQ